MTKAPECPEAEDALAVAITAAIAEPPRFRLEGVRFGQFAAADAGWWWELEFVEQLGNTPGAGHADPIERRIRRIIAVWREDVAKYRDQPGDDEGGDQP